MNGRHAPSKRSNNGDDGGLQTDKLQSAIVLARRRFCWRSPLAIAIVKRRFYARALLQLFLAIVQPRSRLRVSLEEFDRM